ncbi:MAG: hypothetical protein IJW59_04950 [Clostridia bacterium]|nr:hypothetical protein [Clostridia bacterium]
METNENLDIKEVVFERNSETDPKIFPEGKSCTTRVIYDGNNFIVGYSSSSIDDTFNKCGRRIASKSTSSKYYEGLWKSCVDRGELPRMLMYDNYIRKYIETKGAMFIQYTVENYRGEETCDVRVFDGQLNLILGQRYVGFELASQYLVGSANFYSNELWVHGTKFFPKFIGRKFTKELNLPGSDKFTDSFEM